MRPASSALAALALALTSVPAGAAEPSPNDLARERRLVETYRDMLAQEPGQEYAFRRLLETAHVVGGIAGLIELYREAVETDPSDYAAWLVLGNLHRTADEVAAAAEAFEAARALQPKRPDAYLLVAALHRDRRAFAEAFGAYDRAIERLKSRALKQEALRAAAEAAIEAKDVPRAEAYFKALAQTEPRNLFLRMQAASALARLEEPELALAKWKDIEPRAAGQLQHLVIVWKEIASLQSQLGRYEEAEATWRLGLERLPKSHFERRTYIQGLIGVFRRQDRLRELVTELQPRASHDVDLALALARIHEELAEDEKALEYYRLAQKRRPRDEEPRMAALEIIERIGRPEEVLQAWADLVRAFPREARYELKLAELYLQHGKPKDGVALMRRISRGHPTDPGVHARLIDLYLRYGVKNARAEVEAEFKILRRLEPHEPSHVVSLGEFYWSGGDKVRAEATWKRLLKMGKRPGEGHFLLGETYTEHEQYKAAEAELRAAIGEDPDNERYQRALALLLEQRKRHHEALKVWSALSERGAGERATPTTREAREHIIQLWERAERLDKEMGSLRTRFDADPPDVGAGRFLAAALLRLGRVEEAREILERLDSLVPDDLETLAGLERVYSRLGEPKKAMAVLERLARSAPKAAAEYLHRAAELAIGMGDEATALDAAQQVIELAPADASAHARVGDLYLRMGRRSEAADAWRQALSLEPRNFEVRFKLASLYRDLGNPVREEQVLSRIVREAPEAPDILRAGRRLLQLALATGRLAEVEALLRPLVDRGAGKVRGRGAQLRLVVDVYGHLAQAIRFSDAPRSEREAQLAELGERALRPLLDALEDNDVATRARAIETLELTHPPGATPALARLAAEPESMAQVEAISALGRIGTKGAVAALARLGASPQASTRELALWALGFAPTAEAVATLKERTRRGSPRDRAIAALAVGFGRHPAGLELALELARDRSHDVRAVGLWALGRLRHESAIEVLAQRLARPMSIREAQIAAWGLGQIATREARAALVANLWLGATYQVDDAIWLALTYPPETTARDDEVESLYSALANRGRTVLQPIRPVVYMPEAPDPLAGARPLEEVRALVGDAERPGLVTKRVESILGLSQAAGRLALAQALIRNASSFGDGPGLSLVPPQLGDGRELTEHLLAQLAEPLRRSIERHREAATRDAWLAVLARQRQLTDADWAVDLATDAISEARARPDAVVAGALELIARAGGVATDLDPERRRRFFAGLSALSGADSADTRSVLARALVALSGDETDELMAALVQDPVPLVRIALGREIATRRRAVRPELVEELFDLAHDPLRDVGVAAVEALLAQGRPEVRTRLEQIPLPHVQRALRVRMTTGER